MSRPTNRIKYVEIDISKRGSSGHRYQAMRMNGHGVMLSGFGDTKPHAKAALRVVETDNNTGKVLSIAQPQPAAS